MMRTRLGIAAAVGALLAGVVVMPAAAQDKGTLKIGITLPLSGAARADGGPAERGAQLAVDQANEAGGIGGYMFETVVLDHAVNGQYNAAQGAADMQTLANDPNVIGVVGPYNSDVAAAQIPISNAAGLLQCSPANTRIALTKVPDALTYRPTKPDAISYIRVAASDAFQGPGVADYAYNKLGLRNIFVLDDQTGFGVGVSDTFQAQFELYGGKITRQGAAPDTTDFTGVVSQIPPDADGVFYGGVTSSGGGLFQKQLRQAGNVATFLGPDGIKNGSGNDEGSQIQIAGIDAAAGTVASVAAISDFEGRQDFEAAYAEHFKDAPDFKTAGAYSGPAHACASVILQALAAVLEATPDADLAAIREGVRAYSTDSANTFDTVLGPESFDEFGDTTLKFISFFVVDPELADGAGDWVFVEQRQYGEG
jgi:branched-chain amino acid transport system substrate-binding protein